MESDTMGEVAVPVDAYWGAQTQRSMGNFKIGLAPDGSSGGMSFSPRFIRAYGILKHAAARVNAALGLLDGKLAKAIGAAAAEVSDGTLAGIFRWWFGRREAVRRRT